MSTAQKKLLAGWCTKVPISGNIEHWTVQSVDIEGVRMSDIKAFHSWDWIRKQNFVGNPGELMQEFQKITYFHLVVLYNNNQ